MVSEEINKNLIEEICKDLEYHDQNGALPQNKVRIDITLSKEAIEKLNGKNRSRFINDLIMGYEK